MRKTLPLVLFGLSVAALCLLSSPLAAQQFFNNGSVRGGTVITQGSGKLSHIQNTSKVGGFTGDVSWIMDQSEVGVIKGKVSWITGNSRVGAVNGKVSWVIDDARVGLIKGKVSHVKNNARVGVIFGDVSWVADNAYIGLVIGKAPGTMGQGRVGAVVNRQTCQKEYHWLCSWLGYSPPLSERMASAGIDRPAPAAPEIKKAERPTGCSRIITKGSAASQVVEVPVDCRMVRKNILPALRKRPPLKALLTATPGGAVKMLGQPFNSYERDGTMINFYGRQQMVSMHFKDGRPTLILFDLAVDISRESVAAWLGFESLPPPVEVPALNSLVWFDPTNVCIIQVRFPEFKLEGRYIYSVLIHLPGQQMVDRLMKEASSPEIGSGK